MSPRRRRNLVRTLAIVVVLLVVLAGAGALYGYRYADRLVGKGQQPVAGLTPAGPGGAINILLVGSDSRDGLTRRQLGRIQTVEVPGRRTDTIMIVHVSPDRPKPVMISLPRDLRATINGRTTKINAAFAFGGPDLLVKTVEETTGLPINHYAEIDFAGFLDVVNALGGVTLCNRSGARHVDSDFGRIGRQQEFMRAVMAEVSHRGNLTGLPKLLDVADIATDHIKTDQGLSTGAALGLARRLRNAGPASIDMRVYPSVASPPRCAGCAAFVDPLPEAAILMRALARDDATLPPVGLPGGKGVSLAATPVTVLNGSGAAGAAARAAGDLRRLGVRVVGTGNADKPTGRASTLAYPPAMAAQARLLWAVLGGGVTLVKADGGTSLVLTVGSEFRLDQPRLNG
jgi:anionic cell wall polymer biosynthesis LytR-Cps2A-Psr (LCP) family protein